MSDQKLLHILIAEDDEDDAFMTIESFKKNRAFAKISLVKNGWELIEFLKNAGAALPDVVLTDINMPIMNGIDAIKKMCDNPKFGSIPTFVYSTSVNPIYEAECMKLGTRGFLVKPLNLANYDDIPNKIAEVLNANT
jgi:CheY-like chemotaxis protein